MHLLLQNKSVLIYPIGMTASQKIVCQLTFAILLNFFLFCIETCCATCIHFILNDRVKLESNLCINTNYFIRHDPYTIPRNDLSSRISVKSHVKWSRDWQVQSQKKAFQKVVAVVKYRLEPLKPYRIWTNTTTIRRLIGGNLMNKTVVLRKNVEKHPDDKSLPSDKALRTAIQGTLLQQSPPKFPVERKPFRIVNISGFPPIESTSANIEHTHDKMAIKLAIKMNPPSKTSRN